MPHSSGGGSFSGGSHGSFSSSRSTSSTPIYRTFRPGTRRYVYYHRHRPHYYFSEKQAEASSKFVIPFLIIFALFWIGVSIPFWFMTVNHPKRLSMNYDSNIEISDCLDIMSDSEEAQLREVLAEFQDLTGITPSVLTIPNSEWKSDYKSLERYAFNYYIKRYDDEKHWLIVYAGDGASGYEDWNWEGMQGDDTDNVLTTAITDKFNRVMHNELRAGYTVKEAITDSFSEINPVVMETSVNWLLVVLLIFHGGFALIVWSILFWASLKNINRG